MRLVGQISVALLGAVACSVYSENLLTDSAGVMPDGGDMPDTSDAGGSSSGSGSSGSSGSSSTGGSSGGTSSAGGSGGSAGSGGTDIGEGGCVSVGSGGEGGGEQLDCCPNDTLKNDPGLCGCGVPDADSDTDGTVDCLDGCPEDIDKTAAGTCGCGYVDATCDELKTLLIHRYSFGGTGTEATDSIGTAHGTIEGGMLSGGSVTLAGLQTNQYVDLPDGLISSLTDATFEIWSSWSGGASWQRLFDFGDQNTGGTMTGHSYLFLTPLNMNPGSARLVYRKPSGTEVIVDDMTGLYPSVVATHVAAVINDTGNTMSLYINGALKGSVAFPDSLSLLIDTNNWLGRSNYNVDPEFSGSISEFRIYDAALTDAQITLSYQLGADPMFLAQ